MNILKMYAILISNFISNTSSKYRDKISASGIKISLDRILTSKYDRKIWEVVNIPIRCYCPFTFAIMDVMKRKFPNVKVYITLNSQPVTIPHNSRNFEIQLRNAEKVYDEFNNFMESGTASDKYSGKTIKLDNGFRRKITIDDVEEKQGVFESYKYVKDTYNEGGSFSHGNLFIEALFSNRSDIDNFRKILYDQLNTIGVKARELKFGLDSYLWSFGPASFGNKVKNKFRHRLLGNKSITGLLAPKAKGLVGGTGVYFGIDVESSLAFFINLFGSKAGQVALVFGKTGSGKTFACYQLAISLLVENVHCSVIDIKGNEWTNLINLVGGIVISMSGRDSRFVNILRLDDIADLENLPVHVGEEYFDSAVEGVVNFLTIMANLATDKLNPADYNILSDIICRVYQDYKVERSNPRSFKNSKNMKYSDILDKIPVILGSSKTLGEEQRKVCNFIRTRCADYLSSGGSKTNSFLKDEITVSEVINSPLVVYSFDKNNNSLNSLDDLRVFMVQYLDVKKHFIRKQQGLHSSCFYEELQRCNSFGTLVNFIKHMVTGSRSNNVIMFLLSNALNDFDSGAMASIKSNISTCIVGKVSNDDIDILCKHYGCKEIKPLLEKVSSNSDYEHCFAVKYDVGSARDNAIYTVNFPEDIKAVLSPPTTKIEDTKSNRFR